MRKTRGRFCRLDVEERRHPQFKPKHFSGRLISALFASGGRFEVTADDLIKYCEAVAEASGGLFGIRRVSSEERATLDRIANEVKGRQNPPDHESRLELALLPRIKPYLRFLKALYGRLAAMHRRSPAGGYMKVLVLLAVMSVGLGTSASAETLEGRWRLTAAEDLRADGTVARYPWGRRPVGVIVVEGGSCYVQIMSSDVPTFSASGPPVNEQMKASLLSSYIAYTGPCQFDDAAGTTTMKVEAAWRPDYIGTSQTRFYRFEGNKLLYGPAPNSIRGDTEPLTRRLTLERP